MRYSGRDFVKEEIAWIKKIIDEDPELNRHRLSKLFCEKFNWKKKDGGLKDMSCRVAMLRMEKDGVIVLPPLQGKHYKPKERMQWSLFTSQMNKVTEPAGNLSLEFKIVDKSDSWLWNEFIERYHYLGYTPLPGAQLRYLIRVGKDIIALLGFGASAWKTASRDRFIGWTKEQREENLHLVVNNSRFLILPWVRSRNLASRILSMTANRLRDDWEERYKYRPVLLETFVQKDKFRGTCYKAANWIYVGDTKGRGKKDVHHTAQLPKKSVWIYPLLKAFREELCYSGD